MESTEIEQRKYFIASERQNEIKLRKIRFMYQFLRKLDDYVLVISMANRYNDPDTNNARIEWVSEADFFRTEKEAQFEIIRRERFEK
jgi:hypothetical protein